MPKHHSHHKTSHSSSFETGIKPPPPPTSKNPLGVFALQANGIVLTSRMNCVTNVAVDGATLRFGWSDFVLSTGKYDFSKLTKSIEVAKQYNKQLGIYVAALVDVPSSVKCLKIPTSGKHTYLAVPWDAGFLNAFLPFVVALGAVADGQINYIVLGGMGATGESLLSKDPKVIAQLNELGGLDAWVGSCQKITDAYAAAFKTSAFIFSAQNPYGDSPEGSSALDSAVEPLAIKYPNRFGIKNSTLNANTKARGLPNQLIAKYSATNPCGQQFLTNSNGFGGLTLNGTVAETLDAGIALGDKFIEAYDIDTANPKFANDFINASREMGARA